MANQQCPMCTAEGPCECLNGRGNWMTTNSGIRFYPFDPHSDEIVIEDIAHGLSHICRFGGQVDRFYSVAQHSVLVAERVAEKHPELALAALLHDATEAYLGDMVRPLKHSPAGDVFRRVEANLARVIEGKFGLDSGVVDSPSIKESDDVLVRGEAHRLFRPIPEWSAPYDVAGLNTYWNPDAARMMFLSRFWSYGGVNA